MNADYNDEKAVKIKFCIQRVQEMLHYLNNEKRWTIIYCSPTKEAVTKNSLLAERFHVIPGDEYFMIYDKKRLLYCVNVTGDNVLTAIEELMLLLSKKF